MIPSSILFIIILIIGSLISLSSNNWLYLWIGIELNLLSFIPLIARNKQYQETQAAVKYFIIQAVGRGLILTAAIILINNISIYTFTYIPQIIFIIRIIIKLGIAPFHQWLPHVISALPWIKCILLATWQKLSPLIIILFIIPKSITNIILICVIIRAIIGGIGGLNQSQLRPLLAYSSIGHIAWIFSISSIQPNTVLLYFFIYVIITIRLIRLLYSIYLNQSRTDANLTFINNNIRFLIILVLLRLGGLPPILGFIPKWITINTLIFNNIYIVLIPLIMGTLINLFYYLNILFNMILSGPKLIPIKKINIYNLFIIIICTIPSIIFILWPCSWLQH